ncbi:unnamed protein product [Sphagnum troendelagicum]
MTFPSSASQQYHAGSGVVGNIHTANIGTPQGQKVLLLKEINPKQEEEQEQEGENENAYPALAVAADTSSEDQGRGESTDAEATSLNGKLVTCTRNAVIVDRFRMLLFFFQDKEIEGVPITPELASEVQKAEMQEGKGCCKIASCSSIQCARTCGATCGQSFLRHCPGSPNQQRREKRNPQICCLSHTRN